MNSFLETISKIGKLNPESLNNLSRIVKRLELPKGHILVPQYSICKSFYFIEKGLTRTYYLKDGKDITDWISVENTFAVSLISLITRMPDRRIIELLEPSILYSIDYTELETLCEQHHDIENMVRQLVNLGLVQVQSRFDDLHFSTAKQRYQNIINTNPSIIQRVPLGMIATFLGITQETLSRIRAQVNII